MTRNELLSEFDKWAREVLEEYTRLLNLNDSRSNPNSEISGFVFGTQEKYQKLARGLLDIAKTLYPQNPAIPYTNILHAIIRIPLINCIRNTESPEINEEAYSRLFSEVEFLIELKLDSNRAWAYLHQFGCIPDYIGLDGSLRIRRATLIEKYNFELTNQSVGGRTRCEFIVETTSDTKFVKYEESIGISFENLQMLEEFRTLVAVLRLTSPSSTGLNMISIVCSIQIQDDIVIYAINIPPISLTNPAPEIFPAAYSPYVNTQCFLDKHEIELLQRLYNRLKELKLRNGEFIERLQRALRRYNVALTSDQPEDSIVDLIIALEILFKTIGFRMSFRGSYLAGIGPKERKVAVDILEKGRNMRNGIVHGGSSKKEEQKAVLGKLIIVICRILRSYLHIVSKKDNIIDYIEDIVYNPKELSILEKELAKWGRAKTSWVWKPSEPLDDLVKT